MAFYDWNRDGKKDMVDDYLEYMYRSERYGCSEMVRLRWY